MTIIRFKNGKAMEGQLQNDRQIVLRVDRRVLRLDRQVSRVDKRVLRVDNPVLQMEK